MRPYDDAVNTQTGTLSNINRILNITLSPHLNVPILLKKAFSQLICLNPGSKPGHVCRAGGFASFFVIDSLFSPHAPAPCSPLAHKPGPSCPASPGSGCLLPPVPSNWFLPSSLLAQRHSSLWFCMPSWCTGVCVCVQFWVLLGTLCLVTRRHWRPCCSALSDDWTPQEARWRHNHVRLGRSYLNFWSLDFLELLSGEGAASPEVPCGHRCRRASEGRWQHRH